MSNPVIRLKVLQKPQIRGKMDVRFPARVIGEVFIDITKANGTFTISPNYLQLAEDTSYDAANSVIAVQERDGSWKIVSVATFFNNPQVAVRIVAEAGDISVGPNVQLLVMNRTADESPSNIILPLSSAKVGKLKIVDFKGNAGTFPHTISTQGSDKFQGGLTAWTLGGDGASVALDPIPGTGYAV